ncbi:MAG: hypothetical protein D6689_17075 [Deltaproteobacteria bacterium]|nr:MAG: hypothetical protein D6689_17075 [Deltaproteobacteria bacterium]
MNRALQPASCAVAVAVIAVIGTTGIAAAKTARTVSYPYEQVFPAAVRFLRIDEGMKIVERDAEAGYILFELAEDGHTYRGSWEVARVRDSEGRRASRLIVRLEDRPDYMEQGLLDRFGVKLREELGEPADPPRKERNDRPTQPGKKRAPRTP